MKEIWATAHLLNVRSLAFGAMPIATFGHQRLELEQALRSGLGALNSDDNVQKCLQLRQFWSSQICPNQACFLFLMKLENAPILAFGFLGHQDG